MCIQSITADVVFGGHRTRHRQFDRHQHLHPAQAYPRSAVQGRLRTLAQKLDRGAEHVLVERLLLGNPPDMHQCQGRVDVGRSPQTYLNQCVHRPVLVQQHVHPIRHGRVSAGQGLADEAKRQAAVFSQEQAVLGIVGQNREQLAGAGVIGGRFHRGIPLSSLRLV